MSSLPDATFLSLPPELILLIFLFLSSKDQTRLAETCVFIHSAIRKQLWKKGPTLSSGRLAALIHVDPQTILDFKKTDRFRSFLEPVSNYMEEYSAERLLFPNNPTISMKLKRKMRIRLFKCYKRNFMMCLQSLSFALDSHETQWLCKNQKQIKGLDTNFMIGSKLISLLKQASSTLTNLTIGIFDTSNLKTVPISFPNLMSLEIHDFQFMHRDPFVLPLWLGKSPNLTNLTLSNKKTLQFHLFAAINSQTNFSEHIRAIVPQFKSLSSQFGHIHFHIRDNALGDYKLERHIVHGELLKTRSTRVSQEEVQALANCVKLHFSAASASVYYLLTTRFMFRPGVGVYSMHAESD